MIFAISNINNFYIYLSIKYFPVMNYWKITLNIPSLRVYFKISYKIDIIQIRDETIGYSVFNLYK
jgi:hypothetical protein